MRSILIVSHRKDEVAADDIARLFSQKYESVLYHNSFEKNTGDIDRCRLREELKQEYGKKINVLELHQGVGGKSDIFSDSTERPSVLYFCNHNTDLERYGWMLKEEGVVGDVEFAEEINDSKKEKKLPWIALELMLPYSAYGYNPSMATIFFGQTVFDYLRREGYSLNRSSREYRKLIKIGSSAVSRILEVPNPLVVQRIVNAPYIRQLIDRLSSESRKIRERKRILQQLNLRLGDRIDIITKYRDADKNLILEDVFIHKEYGPYISTNGLGTPLSNVKKIIKHQK